MRTKDYEKPREMGSFSVASQTTRRLGARQAKRKLLHALKDYLMGVYNHVKRVENVGAMLQY